MILGAEMLGRLPTRTCNLMRSYGDEKAFPLILAQISKVINKEI